METSALDANNVDIAFQTLIIERKYFYFTIIITEIYKEMKRNMGGPQQEEGYNDGLEKGETI